MMTGLGGHQCRSSSSSSLAAVATLAAPAAVTTTSLVPFVLLLLMFLVLVFLISMSTHVASDASRNEPGTPAVRRLSVTPLPTHVCRRSRRAKGYQRVAATSLAAQGTGEHRSKTPVATALLSAMLATILVAVLTAVLGGIGAAALHVLTRLALGRVAVALGCVRIVRRLARVRRWRAVLRRTAILLLVRRVGRVLAGWRGPV